VRAFAIDNIVHGGFDERAKHCTFHKEQGTKCSRRSWQRNWL